MERKITKSRCTVCGQTFAVGGMECVTCGADPVKIISEHEQQIAELQALLESKLGRQDGTCSKCSIPVYCHETYTVEADCTIICNDCAEVNP